MSNRHDAEAFAAAVTVYTMMSDLAEERELEEWEQLQMDASDATIKRLLPTLICDKGARMAKEAE